jgi:phosphoglycolate phosphatase
VRETLEYIKSQNIKLAIVTNKPHKFVEPIIRMAGLYDLFDYLLGSEVITQKKPQPEPLLYVCNKLAILPEDAIMVGDSYNDIEAAKNANIISIALTYGYNRGRDIRDSKPDFVFSDFGQIAELIKTVA